MSGSATLTMLESSTAMMVPVMTVPAITHLCAACSRVHARATGLAVLAIALRLVFGRAAFPRRDDRTEQLHGAGHGRAIGGRQRGQQPGQAGLRRVVGRAQARRAAAGE